MQNNEALHELARRARVERSLYIAEAISDVLSDVYKFVARQFEGPDAGRQSRAEPVRRLPAHQR